MSFDVTQALVDFLRRWGELSPSSAAVLALVFVAGGLVPVPRTFLTLAAGVVFGMAAVPVIMPATTLGCLIAFLLARYLFAGPAVALDRAQAEAARDHECGQCRRLAHRRAVPARLADPVHDPERAVRSDADRPVALPVVDVRVHDPADHSLCYLGAIGKAALLGESEGLNLGLMIAGGLTFLTVVLLITRRVRASMRELEGKAGAGVL